jgi:hypothetical protein
VVDKDDKHAGLKSVTVTPIMSRSEIGVGLRWDLNRH